MSLLIDEVVRAPRQDRRARRRTRRALRAQDRVSASLAELFTIDRVLADARRIVERGWIQHGWFTYVAPSGKSVTVTACTPRAVRRLADGDVTAACLVGAIIQAAGGPARARNQVVQRTVDATWQALYRGPSEESHACPSSLERVGHVIDLVYWNDRSGRTPGDVVDLLDRTRDQLRGRIERTRSEQARALEAQIALSSGAR